MKVKVSVLKLIGFEFPDDFNLKEIDFGDKGHVDIKIVFDLNFANGTFDTDINKTIICERSEEIEYLLSKKGLTKRNDYYIIKQ